MRDAAVEIVAGSASGLICTLIGHPLDCVKVRQQADAARGRPTSTAARAARMLREEGVQAFARGIGPPLVNAALMNSLMFVVFAECRRMLPDNALGAFASGAIAGVATATLSTPFDYLKIQAQVRGSRPLAVLGATRPGVLFRGHAMNMLREGVFTCVYLGSYDAVRSASFGEERPPLPAVAAVSAASGALAWACNYPFDTVKTAQQAVPPGAPRRSAVDAARALWRGGGAAAFFRGLGPSTTRAVLVTCSRLVAYEWVRGALSY